MMILDLQTGSIIETEQDIWFIYGCWPHPSSYEFFFKTTLLMAATYLGKKTYSTNHLRCFQQVNIFPHPSYQPYVHHKFSCFYFDYYLGILPFSLSPVYSSFPQLRGSAFICWIYYRDLILFVGLAPGEKVAFNWEQWTTSAVSDNLENIKIQEL